MRQAARIAINRTVAGVHFPADSAAGAVLGLTLGQYLVNRANGTATNYRAAEFDGAAYPDNEDFNWSDLFDVTATTPGIDFTTPYVNNMGLAPAGSGSIGRAWLALEQGRRGMGVNVPLARCRRTR